MILYSIVDNERLENGKLKDFSVRDAVFVIGNENLLVKGAGMELTKPEAEQSVYRRFANKYSFYKLGDIDEEGNITSAVPEVLMTMEELLIKYREEYEKPEAKKVKKKESK